MTDPRLVIYRPDKITTPEQAALTAARTLGCTCNPEIVLHDDGIRAVVHHDLDCRLLLAEQAKNGSS